MASPEGENNLGKRTGQKLPEGGPFRQSLSLKLTRAMHPLSEPKTTHLDTASGLMNPHTQSKGLCQKDFYSFIQPTFMICSLWLVRDWPEICGWWQLPAQGEKSAVFLYADGPSGSQLCGNGSEHVGGVLGQSRALLGDPEGICKDIAGEQIPQTFLTSLSPAAVPQPSWGPDDRKSIERVSCP